MPGCNTGTPQEFHRTTCCTYDTIKRTLIKKFPSVVNALAVANKPFHGVKNFKHGQSVIGSLSNHATMATRTPPNKRLNEQNNSCTHAL